MPINFVEKYWQERISPQLMKFVQSPLHSDDLLPKVPQSDIATKALLVYKEGYLLKFSLHPLLTPQLHDLDIVHWFGLCAAALYITQAGSPEWNTATNRQTLILEPSIQLGKKYLTSFFTTRQVYQDPSSFIDRVRIGSIRQVDKTEELSQIKDDLINFGANRLLMYLNR
jgi:hypothetical protein